MIAGTLFMAWGVDEAQPWRYWIAGWGWHGPTSPEEFRGTRESAERRAEERAGELGVQAVECDEFGPLPERLP